MIYRDLRPEAERLVRVLSFSGGADAMSYALDAFKIRAGMVASESVIVFHCYEQCIAAWSAPLE